jgi:GT2 family glycosyltransferase
MLEFDSETGGAIATHLEGQEGWVAEELLLWERPVINGPGGTVMVSREAFDAVDGFDERIKVGEDWDFCYRVARQFKVGFVREPLVNYRSHSAAAHRNVRNMERGMRLFYQKAFSSGPNIEKKVKNRALANFHRILAGSYFYSGEYGQFIKHGLCSIWHRPAGISYFLEFPLRRLRANRTEGF